MQVFGNVATAPLRKVSKSLNRGYYEFRLAEALRTNPLAGKSGSPSQPTWYTVRIMVDKNPEIDLGNFVRATGTLKVDSFIGRDGKPASGLVLIAFDVSKIAKNSGAPKQILNERPSLPEPISPQALVAEKADARAQERQQATEPQYESDWSSLYS